MVAAGEHHACMAKRRRASRSTEERNLMLITHSGQSMRCTACTCDERVVVCPAVGGCQGRAGSLCAGGQRLSAARTCLCVDTSHARNTAAHGWACPNSQILASPALAYLRPIAVRQDAPPLLQKQHNSTAGLRHNTSNGFSRPHTIRPLPDACVASWQRAARRCKPGCRSCRRTRPGRWSGPR